MDATDLNDEVIGYIFYGNEGYLLTDNYMVKFKSENDPWQEYYRKIYNDTTIINPNTIIEPPALPVNIYPLLDLSKYTDNYFQLNDNKILSDFFAPGGNGQFILQIDALKSIGQKGKKLEEKKK